MPRGSSTDWDPSAAKLGLSELRRLRGEMSALEAVLVRVLKTETGRDTKALLAQGFGMSDGEARKAEEISDIAGRVPGVEDALADGSVTGEHVRRLKPITDLDDASELLALAATQSPDEFGKTVDKFRIERDAKRMAREAAEIPHGEVLQSRQRLRRNPGDPSDRGRGTGQSSDQRSMRRHMARRTPRTGRNPRRSR